MKKPYQVRKKANEDSLTVRDLREALKGLPADTPIVMVSEGQYDEAENVDECGYEYPGFFWVGS